MSEVNNNHKNKDWKSENYFIHLVFLAQYIHIWMINETQTHNLCIWSNEKMGSKILGNLWCSGKLDKCRVTISYSKYK